MTRNTVRIAATSAVILGVLALARPADATVIPSAGVNLNSGSFSASLGGTGTAVITGGGGNYRQWISLGFFWQSVNTGITLNAQNRAISMSNVNINNPAFGTADIGYDNLTPGTPTALNSLNADLDAGTDYNFTINVDPITLSVAGIINTSIGLTVNGTITDAAFNSTGSSAASPYGIAGDLDLTLQGTVTGVLDPGGLNISLGTIYTLPSSTFTVNTVLPGAMLLTDLSGGSGPYPADMGVNLAAAIPASIPVPLSIPINTSETFNPGTHVSGFTSLTINPGSMLNANLMLGNPSYSLSGTIQQALIPEPGTLALGSLGLVALSVFGLRRRKSA